MSNEDAYGDTGPRSGPPDALVLDIGGDVGALIVYTDETFLGVELDITPEHAPQDHAVHTVIRRRRVSEHDVICGVYPQLAAGVYTLWGTDHRALACVHVAGGRVAEIHVEGSRSRPPDRR